MSHTCSIKDGPHTRSRIPSPYSAFSAQRTGCPSGSTMSSAFKRRHCIGSSAPVITPCTASAVTARDRRSLAACRIASQACA